MKLSKASLNGDLDDLLHRITHDAQAVQEFREAFAGGNPNGEFRIPDADAGREVFFNNPEMLARFATLTQPSQKDFLMAVRAVMKEGSVDVLHISVPWGPNGEKRVIKIEQINSLGCLNVYV